MGGGGCIFHVTDFGGFCEAAGPYCAVEVASVDEGRPEAGMFRGYALAYDRDETKVMSSPYILTRETDFYEVESSQENGWHKAVIFPTSSSERGNAYADRSAQRKWPGLKAGG